ncbi:MAG: class I adenylate-forming enzyme family protein [Ruegeria sp.]
MKDNTSRLVLGSLLRRPNKPVLGDDSVCLDRSSLFENVRLQGNLFLQSGLRPDDFVVLMCDRGLAFWSELLAAWVLGAKPICVEKNISDEHAASVVQMTSVSKIIGADETTTPEFKALESLPSSFDPNAEAGDLRSCFRDLPFVDDSELPDLAGLIFTSGTTGLPKGVPLTHRALNLNALSTAQRLQLRDSDRLLIATPFRFISSISHFLVTLLSGAAFFGVERTLMIKDLIDILNDRDISAFGGSPFHMQFIAMAGEHRLPKLRWAMSSGDHLRREVIEKLAGNFANLELHVVYGMAELGGRFCELPPQYLSNKAGSVGFPINGFEITIRRDDGSTCDVGEVGNIYVSGQIGFEGYFRNIKANQKVLSSVGFLNGDMGFVDDEGFVFLSGRSDSVFKRSGLKVSAQIISDALMNLDEIHDVFCTSEENDFEGRVPVAYIAWKNESEMDSGEISRTLRRFIPVNHIPARYVSLPEIPRTGSGKVDRRRLASLIEATKGSSKAEG